MNRRGFLGGLAALLAAPWLRSVVRPAAEARIGAESGHHGVSALEQMRPIEEVRRRYFPGEMNVFTWDDSPGPIWHRAPPPAGPDTYYADFSWPTPRPRERVAGLERV